MGDFKCMSCLQPMQVNKLEPVNTMSTNALEWLKMFCVEPSKQEYQANCTCLSQNCKITKVAVRFEL